MNAAFQRVIQLVVERADHPLVQQLVATPEYRPSAMAFPMGVSRSWQRRGNRGINTQGLNQGICQFLDFSRRHLRTLGNMGGIEGEKVGAGHQSLLQRRQYMSVWARVEVR